MNTRPEPVLPTLAETETVWAQLACTTAALHKLALCRYYLANAVDGATIRDDGRVVLPGHVHGIKDADDLLRALREVGQ